MITDEDVEKLKKTFATKDGVGEDLRVLKEDLLDAMEKQKTEIIGAIAEVIQESINPILDNHDVRIADLEKRAPAAL